MRPTVLLVVGCVVVLSACAGAQPRSSEPTGQPASSEPIFSLRQVDTAPRMAGCQEPNPLTDNVPLTRVRVRFVLGREGRPEWDSMTAREGLNWRQFAEVAKDRTRHCEWTPALVDGKAVRVWMTYMVRFERQ